MAFATTIGFPRMMKESGEKRVFLPEFIRYLTELGAEVCLEEGYGSRSGFTFEDYQLANPKVHNCSREQVFHQDYVMVLRAPKLEEFDLLGENSCLISMLHYPTRPKRVQRLKELGRRKALAWAGAPGWAANPCADHRHRHGGQTRSRCRYEAGQYRAQ
jgi:alanine dehydrogenase